MNENRASQIESMLKNLPQTAEQGLSGLNAGIDLRSRIQLTAAQQKKPRISYARLVRWASAACCALLVLGLGIGLFSQVHPTDLTDQSLFTSSTLGGETTQAPALTADLGGSGVIITAGNKNPGFRDMWAPASNGSFPPHRY